MAFGNAIRACVSEVLFSLTELPRRSIINIRSDGGGSGMSLDPQATQDGRSETGWARRTIPSFTATYAFFHEKAPCQRDGNTIVMGTSRCLSHLRRSCETGRTAIRRAVRMVTHENGMAISHRTTASPISRRTRVSRRQNLVSNGDYRREWNSWTTSGKDTLRCHQKTIHRTNSSRLTKVYRNSAPSISTVKKWAAELKRGRTSLEGVSREGRPTTLCTISCWTIGECVRQLRPWYYRKKGRRRYARRYRNAKTLRKVGAAFGEFRSKLNAQTTFAAMFGLIQVAMDEIWVYHYMPETKQLLKQLVEADRKKAKSIASAGKVMARKNNHISPGQHTCSQKYVGNGKIAEFEVQFSDPSLLFSLFSTLRHFHLFPGLKIFVS
ncbi:hypothetical protein LAZ67_20001148 [Cordylochernes scorpioides]|uniref:Ribosomal protein L16 n=1 Tax=Cordylochernes scorpioides TaxID=51811 RepID=A0ABY6LPI8_9ARAC|nr:hypothetical protein LAZ67_20001148 [Cordylochernes scorpioides]